MSDSNTKRYRLDPESSEGIDHVLLNRIASLTDAEIEAAASADPDAALLTDAELMSLRRVPNLKAIRESQNMNIEEFADAYGLPASLIRAWEESKAVTHPLLNNYLRVIEKNPKAVREALSAK